MTTRIANPILGKTKPDLDAKGDCYRTNGKLFLEIYWQHPEMAPTTRLCHGWVTPRTGKCKGRTFHHAWVELQEDLVLDYCNGGKVTTCRGDYYKYGRIEESLVVRYDYEQVMVRLLKTKEWSLGSV